jgi:hypothetical protein
MSSIADLNWQKKESEYSKIGEVKLLRGRTIRKIKKTISRISKQINPLYYKKNIRQISFEGQSTKYLTSILQNY